MYTGNEFLVAIVRNWIPESLHLENVFTYVLKNLNHLNDPTGQSNHVSLEGKFVTFSKLTVIAL